MKKFVSLLLVLMLAIVPFSAVNAATFTPGEYEATAQGFGGDVTVKATIDNGTITALTVETPDETAGLGQKCSDAEFTSQFFGKAIPVELG